jgi:hypothetical protein
MKDNTIKSEIAAAVKSRLAPNAGCKFGSFTYTSKTSGEVARHTVILGMSYHELVRQSVEELSALTTTNVGKWNELQVLAAREVMVSLEKTLAAHAVGQQNDDYTKKDVYISIGNGISLNTNDNTLQLFGLASKKVVITPGVFKSVKSAPLTLAKNEIRNLLSVSKFREFALDVSQIESINFGN